jgi:hypothetical protein
MPASSLEARSASCLTFLSEFQSRSCDPRADVYQHAGYVETLNTNSTLYSLLVRALDDHEQKATQATRGQKEAGSSLLQGQEMGKAQEQPVQSMFTAEALRVGRSLRHDFEKAGIHLPDDKRCRLTHLTGLQRRLGMAIGNDTIINNFFP